MRPSRCTFTTSSTSTSADLHSANFTDREVAHTSCILGRQRFVGDATTAAHGLMDGGHVPGVHWGATCSAITLPGARVDAQDGFFAALGQGSSFVTDGTVSASICITVYVE